MSEFRRLSGSGFLPQVAEGEQYIENIGLGKRKNKILPLLSTPPYIKTFCSTANSGSSGRNTYLSLVNVEMKPIARLPLQRNVAE